MAPAQRDRRAGTDCRSQHGVSHHGASLRGTYSTRQQEQTNLSGSPTSQPRQAPYPLCPEGAKPIPWSQLGKIKPPVLHQPHPHAAAVRGHRHRRLLGEKGPTQPRRDGNAAVTARRCPGQRVRDTAVSSTKASSQPHAGMPGGSRISYLLKTLKMRQHGKQTPFKGLSHLHS